MLGSVERLQCLFSPVRRKQPLGDLRGNIRYFSRLPVILGDECINITLGIRNLGQCLAYRAGPGPFGRCVDVVRAPRPVGGLTPLPIGRLANGFFRQRDHALLQMLQACLPQGRCQNLEQRVVLTIAVVDQRLERVVGKPFRSGPCGFRKSRRGRWRRGRRYRSRFHYCHRSARILSRPTP